MNDSVEDALGDRIIAITAKRLVKIVPEAMMIARMHGDSFCLVFNAGINLDEVITRLFDFTQRPLALRGEIIVVGIRIGVADAECGAENACELLHAAEVALHYAKRNDKKISKFDPSMVEDARSRHRLENDLRISLAANAAALRGAIVNEEFFLCYQPIISASNGKVHAFEALLRWNHPKRGIVAPSCFIPIAEEIGVMDVLGEWVLQRACADAATWLSYDGDPAPSVSVNVSRTQLHGHGLFEQVLDKTLRESGLPPDRLKLEVTETAAAGHDLTESLRSLRSRGCGIALDDFGTGYSSLTQLHALPIDYIKIDQSFVRGWEHCDGARASQSEQLTRSILALAKVMSFVPIVEGVESEIQIRRVQEWGGDLIQGYVYSKPMPADAVAGFLKNNRRA